MRRSRSIGKPSRSIPATRRRTSTWEARCSTRTGPPTALVEFRETLRLNPASDMAHNNLGYALLETGDLPGAIAEFQEALRLNPGNPFARKNLADVLVHQLEQ